MEPKYYAFREVIGHPNYHHLRIWRLIPRARNGEMAEDVCQWQKPRPAAENPTVSVSKSMSIFSAGKFLLATLLSTLCVVVVVQRHDRSKNPWNLQKGYGGWTCISHASWPHSRQSGPKKRIFTNLFPWFLFHQFRKCQQAHQKCTWSSTCTFFCFPSYTFYTCPFFCSLPKDRPRPRWGWTRVT